MIAALVQRWRRRKRAVSAGVNFTEFFKGDFAYRGYFNTPNPEEKWFAKYQRWLKYLFSDSPGKL